MNTYCPKNKEDWRNWLKENHLIQDSIWLIFYKKQSPTPNLSWSEAVDQVDGSIALKRRLITKSIGSTSVKGNPKVTGQR